MTSPIEADIWIPSMMYNSAVWCVKTLLDRALEMPLFEEVEAAPGNNICNMSLDLPSVARQILLVLKEHNARATAMGSVGDMSCAGMSLEWYCGNTRYACIVDLTQLLHMQDVCCCCGRLFSGACLIFV